MRMRQWAWAGLILTGVNCVAILDGDHPYKAGDTSATGTPCTTDTTCDDKNPCTTDSCSPEARVCEYVTQADGLAPDSTQTAANCQRAQCVTGNLVNEADPQDVLSDDNSCTSDSCSGGTPVSEVLPDDTICMLGMNAGSCKEGACVVACTTNTDCNDGNSCSEDLCNTSAGACVYTNLDGVPTPGATQVAGDCKIQFCANGIDTSANDDSDVFEDNNPCTTDICTEGVFSNPGVSEGTPCTPGDVNVCDGNGMCVECTMSSHCVDITETECEKRNCVDNKCEIAYEGTGTLASQTLQTSNDCKKVVCNGNLGTTSVNDITDLPVDGNACTKDICTNGVPSNPFEPLNASCGGGLVCNATGQCQGCNIATQCPGTDDACKARTCTTGQCGFAYTTNGIDLPTGQTAGDCKVLECDGMGNVKTSVLISDVPVDGNPCTQDLCNAAGTPSNPASAINSPCNVGSNDACDGNGTCKKSLGKVCVSGNSCVSAICVDGVCCNNTCTTLCRSCNVTGSVGTCTDVPKGQDDSQCSGTTQSCNAANDCDDENGQACTANSACLSNFCADGVCCNSACDTACKSCNVTGSAGTCGNLPAGSQDNAPTNLCIGGNQCDGLGVCKGVDGATCNTPTECVSGFCVDGVCCNTACTGTCTACSSAKTAGNNGTCAPIFGGTDPDNECTLNCDGLGNCMP